MKLERSREHVDAALPLLHDAFGFDNAKLRTLSWIAIAVYAGGKVFMGALGDRIGGRCLMLCTMMGFVTRKCDFAKRSRSS